MIPAENLVKRLTFIKFIYEAGIEQSNNQEPFSSQSILTFHDAVELFIHLACEHLDINKSFNDLIAYWDEFSRVNKPLNQKEAMRRFFKARTNLKHFGILPHKIDIESYRASVTNFFQDNTQLLFGIEFSNISMIDLVSDSDVKDFLLKAETCLNGKQIKEALDNVSIAYFILTKNYDKRLKNEYGKSPFSFDDSFMGVTFKTLDDKFSDVEDALGEVGSEIDTIEDAIESIQQAIKPLTLGIDYSRHFKFKLLTPSVLFYGREGVYTTRERRYGNKGFSNIRGC